jgi:hypothetical protein
MEYGIVILQGIRNITKSLPNILSDEEIELSMITKQFVRDLHEQILLKTKKIVEYAKLIEAIFKQNVDCQKIAKIEGVGVLTATAILWTNNLYIMFQFTKFLCPKISLATSFRRNSTGRQIIYKLYKLIYS